MISIIIPTYNEERQISGTIRHLLNEVDRMQITEIIVSDGRSQDKTTEIASVEGAKVIISQNKGRAAQMNAGAKVAMGPVLYFLHADTLPPIGFTKDILRTTATGTCSGCYRLSFDYRHWFLRILCWFTRFNVNAVRFGDQSLFVEKQIFTLAGGFRESQIILEDQEIIGRIRKIGRFRVLPGTVITSARKYIENGIYRTQTIYFLIYLLYRLGFSQPRLIKFYKSMIR